MHVEALLARLEGVRQRGRSKWSAKCPAHQDKSPSLSIMERADGRILLHDFGGCDTQAVLDALGLEFVGADIMTPEEKEDAEKRRTAGESDAQRAERLKVQNARSIVKVLAHEAFVVAVAAEQVARGEALNETDTQRMYDAITVLRRAASDL